MNRLLVISPHPDDESVSCGGTLLRLKEEGWELYWLIITDVFPGTIWSEDFIRNRKEEIPFVGEAFGFTETINLGYPTTTLDSVSKGELIRDIFRVVTTIKPTWVFLPNHSDVHSDHRVTFETAMAACKSFRAPFIKKIMMYECISETEYAPPFAHLSFHPNLFVDITRYFDAKLKAVNLYRSEIHPSPFPRSNEVIEALARFRGSRIGVTYAESFMTFFESL